MSDHATKRNYSIAVDFDGVLHSYLSPWVSAGVIPDPPVPGAIEWLTDIEKKFEVIVFTTRGKTREGRDAVRRWLWENGYSGKNSRSSIQPETWSDLTIVVTAEKPPALIYLDDRAVRFEGSFPTADEIHGARPWRAAPAPAEEKQMSEYDGAGCRTFLAPVAVGMPLIAFALGGFAVWCLMHFGLAR